MASNPKKKAAPPARPTPRRDEVLAAIAAADLSDYALAEATDGEVSRSQIGRFRSGSSDLTLSKLERLAPLLRLKLVKLDPPKRRK